MNSGSVVGTFVVGSPRRTCVRTVFFRCTLGELRVHDLCAFRGCRSTASFHPQETPTREPSPPDRAQLDRRPEPPHFPLRPRGQGERVYRKTLLTRSNPCDPEQRVPKLRTDAMKYKRQTRRVRVC